MTPKYYSQAGEDAVLAEIFENQATGTCLEVGVLDGVKDSITLYFEERGWKCVLVEANPELAEKAKQNRKGPVFSCAAGSSPGEVEFLIARGAEYLSTMCQTEHHISRILGDGATIDRVTVPVRRIDDLLEEAGITRLDFATIDVEGAELEVLKGFSLERWRPKVVMVEEVTRGSDLTLWRYLRAHNYRRFLHTGWNDWYAHESDRTLLTPARVVSELGRRVRTGIYRWTFGFLPGDVQQTLVRWKHKCLGDL